MTDEGRKVRDEVVKLINFIDDCDDPQKIVDMNEQLADICGKYVIARLEAVKNKPQVITLKY